MRPYCEKTQTAFIWRRNTNKINDNKINDNDEITKTKQLAHQTNPKQSLVVTEVWKEASLQTVEKKVVSNKGTAESKCHEKKTYIKVLKPWPAHVSLTKDFGPSQESQLEAEKVLR